MIKAKAGDTVILGVDQENLRRLKSGMPILIKKGEISSENIVVVYGKDLEICARNIEKATGIPVPMHRPHETPQ